MCKFKLRTIRPCFTLFFFFNTNFIFVFINKRKPLNIYYRKSDLFGHYEDILDFNNENNKINRQNSNDTYYKVNENRKRSSELYNTLYEHSSDNETIQYNDCIEMLPPTRQPTILDETARREPLPSYCSNHDQEQVQVSPINESITKRNSFIAWFLLVLLITLSLALLYFFFNGHDSKQHEKHSTSFETKMKTSCFFFKFLKF